MCKAPNMKIGSAILYRSLIWGFNFWKIIYVYKLYVFEYSLNITKLYNCVLYNWPAKWNSQELS